MSLTVDGVWKVGVWATTVWADNVWREGPPSSQTVGGSNMGMTLLETTRTKMASNPTDIDRDYSP